MKKTLLFACILAGSAHPQNCLLPGGLAQAPDGSLFITDDMGGTIWRVSYRATLR